MSEIMRPMSIGHLMHWIMSEYEQKKSIFGIEKIVKHENGRHFRSTKRRSSPRLVRQQARTASWHRIS